MGLAKVRHPGVIALVEPWVEDESSAVFITERLVGNLVSVIQQKKLK